MKIYTKSLRITKIKSNRFIRVIWNYFLPALYFFIAGAVDPLWKKVIYALFGLMFLMIEIRDTDE